MIGARAVLQVAHLLGPSAPGAIAERIFRTPARYRAPEREQALLRSGRPLGVHSPAGELRAWHWESGPRSGPTVLLVHGWAGRAGQFSSIVPALLEAGFSAIAFDGPGHGESGGRLSSLPEMAAAVHSVGLFIERPRVVIAHSFGAAATVLAMHRGLAVDRAIFLAPAADFDSYLRRFQALLGLSAAACAAMIRRIERRFHVRWSDLHVPTLARGMRVPLLAFHDWQDAEVPYRDAQMLVDAWPRSTLVTTAGLSHRRILHEPQVIERAIAFLREERPRVRPPLGAELRHRATTRAREVGLRGKE